MNLTLDKRLDLFRDVKKLAKENGSTYRLSLVDKHKSVLTKAVCTLCNNVVIQSARYFQKMGCWCQRGAKIALANNHIAKSSHKKFFNDIKNRNIKLLSWEDKFNAIARFKCLSCGHKWKTSAGNVRKGSGCRNCYFESQRGPLPEKKRKAYRAKFEATMLRRYGVKNALESPVFFKKNQMSSYKRYDYSLGNRIVQVQGYEPYALDYLIKDKNISPNKIVVDIVNIPSIKYELNGKIKTYHPDIYIPSRNLLIEVKSWYTYKCSQKKNTAKKIAAKSAGYKFKFLIMNRDGTRRDPKESEAELRERNPNYNCRKKGRRRKN